MELKMKLFYYFLLLLLILLININFSQVPGVEWSRTYSCQSIKDFERTIDGGYILVGSKVTQTNAEDFCLVKTDSSGSEIWSKTYGGFSVDLGQSVKITDDGGYILAGYTYSYGNFLPKFLLVKTNSSGDTAWTRVFG
jgi:hypothetical protein